MSFVDNLYTTAQRNNGVGICVVQSPRAFFPEMEGNGPKVFSIQSSNVIFFPSVLYKEDKPCDFKLELRVLKARMGRTGTVYTRWF